MISGNNIAKPFLKWVGGKGQLLPSLYSLLPYNFEKIEDITYIEPFIGGGAMLFFMLQRFKNIKKAVINDSNENLIRAYRSIKHSPEKVVQALDSIQKEYYQIKTEEKRKEFYLESRKTFNDGNLSDIDNTMYLIFLNRTCFNGLYRVNSKGMFNVPFGKYSNPKICDENTIYADSELLQKVDIINADFEETEKFLSENTFMYFDPPYRPLDATSNFNSYSKEAFNDNEQIRLKNYFKRLSDKGCLLMLSNSDCKGRNPNDSFFDDLYSEFFIERVYASRSVNANPNKRGKLTELLIRNYKHTESNVHGEIIPLTTNIKSYAESTYRRTV